KMHHIFTFLIGIFIWSANLQLPGWQGSTGVAKLAVMYGMFSSLPYMVNIFLGLRVFVPKNKLTVLVSFISLLSYLVCCSCNWSIHIYWLILCIINLDITVWGTLYTIVLFYIVRDDLVLMKFLVKYTFTDYDPKKKRN
ncbi:hypothetical protein, partial [Salmonella sp. s51228]|uniref:hypothetical protein n=1 Tax=Salmonella sp. s51228 TaxID=3159652 RepID=UPI00397FC5E3